MNLSGTVRTTLVFGLALIVLILLTALVAPRMIDMRGAVPMISAEMSKALGQPVQVRGEALLGLVPSPRLIVKDVATVAGDAATLKLNAEEVRANLAWGDLLLGNYSISNLVLVRPVIELPSSGLSLAGATLPQIVIERGQVTVIGRAQPLTMDGVEAELNPTTSGGLTWAVSGVLDSLAVEATGRFGVPSKNGAQNIQATFRLPEADVALEVSGLRNAPEKSFDGKLAVSALHATDALALSQAFDLDPMRWPMTRQALALNADIKVANDQAQISNGTVKVADQAASFTGSASFLDHPTFALTVELGSLDISAWLPAVPSQTGPAQPSTSQPQILDRVFASQAPWQGDVKVNAQGLRLGEHVLRDFAVDARLDGAQTTLRNAAITLPGQTRVSLSGLWNNDAQALDGAWRVTNQDMRALLGWLSVPLDSVPEGRLTSFSANGTVQAGDKIIALNDIALGLDASRAKGRVAFGWSARAPTTINLDIDRLALDAYAPLLASLITLPRAATPTPASSNGYGVKPLAPWLATLAQQRGNVRIGIKDASWKETLSGAFGVDVALNEDGADIRSLAFEGTSGLSLWLGGKVKNLDTVPVAEGVQFDAKVVDVPRFLRSFAIALPGGVKAISPLALSGSVSGLLSGAVISADGKLGPMTLKSRGTLSLNETDTTYFGDIDVAHPNANDLRAALWPGASFAGKLSGPFTLSGKINAIPQQTEITSVNFAFGPHTFQAQAIVNDAVDPRSVSVSISNIDMDWNALAPVPFLPIPKPGDWSGVVTLAGPRLKSSLFDARDFSVRYVVTKNTSELAEWTGKLFGGRSQVALKWSKIPDVENAEHWADALQGQIVVSDANPALIVPGLPPKGQGDLTFSFAATAASAAGWADSFSGSGNFHVMLPANAVLKNGGALAPMSAVVRAETPDGRTLSNVESTGNFTMSKSVVTFSELGVRANAYAATFGGGLDFARDAFDLKGTLRLRDRGQIAGPSAQLVLPPVVPMTITGPLQAPTIKMDIGQR